MGFCFAFFFFFVLLLILLLKRKASGYSTITPNSKKSLIKTQLTLKLHEAHKEPIDLPNWMPKQAQNKNLVAVGTLH